MPRPTWFDTEVDMHLKQRERWCGASMQPLSPSTGFLGIISVACVAPESTLSDFAYLSPNDAVSTSRKIDSAQQIRIVSGNRQALAAMIVMMDRHIFSMVVTKIFHLKTFTT